MKLNSKEYKFKKIENYIKNNKLIFFTTIVNIKPNSNLKSFFINNAYLKRVLANSIYNKLKITVNGINNLLVLKKKNFDYFSFLKKSLNAENESVLIALKINNKIYSPTQLKTLKSLNYSKNIFYFYNSLKKQTQFPSKTFVSK